MERVQPTAPPIGRFQAVVIDCPEARALADFYQSLVGGEILDHHDGWVELRSPPTWHLAFQTVEHYRAPTWPTGDVPQQAHIDIVVEDLDAAEAAAVDRGAVRAPEQPTPWEFRVLFDPAGRPFCVVDPTGTPID